MKKKKLILLYLLFLFFSALFSDIDFTAKELEYLASKSSFKILVTANNYPYEYIDDNGHHNGINISYIKEILAFFKKKLIFVTDIEDDGIDIVSSFVIQDIFTLCTARIYESDVYFMYKKIQNVDDDNYFLTINQDFLFQKLINLYPDRRHILSDNIMRSKYFVDTNPNTILVFDSFSRKFFVNHKSDDYIIELQNDLDIHFDLSVRRDNEILFNILSKSIQANNEKNMFYKSFIQFQKQTDNYFTFQRFERIVKIITIIVFIFLLLCIFIVINFKVYRLNLQALILRFKEQNTILQQKIDTLSYQIDSIKSENFNVLQKINGLTFLLDLKGNIIFINDYCKTALGFNSEDLVGQNIDKIVSKENRQKLLNLSNVDIHLRNLQNQPDIEKQNPFEIEIISKDGLKKNFIFTTFFTKSQSGNTEINCILLNISDRKILQNKLEGINNNLDDMIKQRIKAVKESEERFKFVIDKTYNAIFVLKNNYFTLANDALTVLTGYPTSSFLDKALKFPDIIDQAECDSIMEKISQNISQKVEYFYLQTRVRNHIGDLTEVEIHFTTTIQDDEIILLGVIHDISVKKEYEEKKRQTDRLNLLSQFAISANDKINSPLNALLGYVELLELTNKKPTVPQLKAYATIYESINIIKKVLHRLKSLTKINQQNYNYADLKMLDLSLDNIDEKEENPDEQ